MLFTYIFVYLKLQNIVTIPSLGFVHLNYYIFNICFSVGMVLRVISSAGLFPGIVNCVKTINSVLVPFEL